MALPGPSWLSTDGRCVLLARVLRNFGYGFVAVVLGVHVAELGLSGAELGVLLAASLLGSSVFTVLVALRADQLGRRRSLQLFAAFMALTGAAYALTDQFWLLLAATLTGTISASTGEVGPFLTLEQALLPQTASDERRTRLFTWYNLLGYGAVALGSLFAGLVAVAAARAGLAELATHRLLFWFYALLAAATFILFASLTPAVERGPAPAVASFLGVQRSRGIVLKLTALFGLDAFGGGLVVQSLIAYWFNVRFGLGLETLGPVFFGSNLLSALSLLAAERLAARIGLVNTMVFTHLPSNVGMALMPLMPTPELAILLHLARNSLSSMDVPTRQSYLMAVVDPAERTAAAGFTTLGRNVAQVFAPALGGLAMQTAALGLPFVIGGALKIVYDLTLWALFHAIRPPEEQSRSETSSTGDAGEKACAQR